MRMQLLFLLTLLSLFLAGCCDEEPTDDRQTKPSTETTNTNVKSEGRPVFTKDEMPSEEKLTQLVTEYLNENNPSSEMIDPCIYINENDELWQKLGILLFCVSKTKGSHLFSVAYIDDHIMSFNGNMFISNTFTNDCFYYSYVTKSNPPNLVIGYIRRGTDKKKYFSKYGYLEDEESSLKKFDHLFKQNGKVYVSWNETMQVVINDSYEIILVKGDGTEINTSIFNKKPMRIPPMPTNEKLTELAAEYLKKNNSSSEKIEPNVSINENDEIWNKLGVLLLSVSKTKGSGIFTMAYYDDKVVGFGENFLLSHVYQNECFYYSYYFGSGIPTLLIGYIRRVNGEIQHVANFGFPINESNDALMGSYLYKKEGKVYLSAQEKLMVKINESDEILLVKEDGTEIRSKLFKDKQQTKPEGD